MINCIVAGLGNPGKKYIYTRHNAGFLAVDYISQRHGFRLKDGKFSAICGKADFGGAPGEALFMKPLTYMNRTGESIAAASRFYKVPPENILIIFDDISLPAGKLRIRKSGSAGGHNGVKSIIQSLGTDAFPRIKIGVGVPENEEHDLADYVLSPFSKTEQKIMFDTFVKTYEAVCHILKSGSVESGMNLFNVK